MSSYTVNWASINCTGDQDVIMLYIGFSRYSVKGCVCTEDDKRLFDFFYIYFEDRGVKMVYIFVIFVL